jgi:hypothetical protein
MTSFAAPVPPSASTSATTRGGGRATHLVLAIFAVTASLGLPVGAAQAAECPRHVDDVQGESRPLEQPIVLTPAGDSQQRLKNFGSKRGTMIVKKIRIDSDKPLPRTVTPDRLNLEAFIQRTGDKLASVDFPDPTFTQPRISQDRRHFTFDACINADGMGAGKYDGTITVSGPAGLGEARVLVTSNLKADPFVWFGGSLVAILFAAGALYLKPGGTRNRTWWLKTVGALAVSIAAVVAVYVDDPSWGADPWSAVIALFGTAFASIGGRKLLFDDSGRA